MAEGPGFEPGLTGPEPVVLPLDDPPVLCNNVYYIIILFGSRTFENATELDAFESFRVWGKHTSRPS